MSRPEDFGEIIFTFDVLYAGWEVDNKGYVIRDHAGANKLVLSNHGHWYVAEPSELNERINAYEEALSRTREALSLIQ